MYRNEYVLNENCRPCNFVCDGCMRLIYRCSAGIDMYINEFKKLCICEDCHYYDLHKYNDAKDESIKIVKKHYKRRKYKVLFEMGSSINNKNNY